MSSSAPSHAATDPPGRPARSSRVPCSRAAKMAGMLALAALVACGGARTGAGTEGDGPRAAEREGAVFVVDSRLVGPVSVYATTGVNRVRLGTINVSQEKSWPVPEDMVGRGHTVRLVLDQVGGPSVATERFSVEAGDTVYLTVTEQIFQSGVTLRVQMGG